jgi:hypothetical protein
MFLQVARIAILVAEQEKNFSYLAQILGPTLAWERWLSNYLKTTETVQQTVDAGRCCHGNRSVGAAPLKDQSCIRRRGWTKRGAEQLQASSWYRLLMPARMPLCPSYRAPCPMSGQSVAAHRVAGRAHRLASLCCCCIELVSPKMASR